MVKLKLIINKYWLFSKTLFYRIVDIEEGCFLIKEGLIYRKWCGKWYKLTKDKSTTFKYFRYCKVRLLDSVKKDKFIVNTHTFKLIHNQIFRVY